MGGNCAWTLRTAEGIEHRMDRWTNILPWAITNLAFLTAESAHLDAVLASWQTMGDDWRRHAATGDFEHPMTAAYAPYPFGLKPSEYGVVVTDFSSHTIISAQDYTVIGRIGLFAHDDDETDSDSAAARLKAFFDAGRLKSAVVRGRDKEGQSHRTTLDLSGQNAGGGFTALKDRLLAGGSSASIEIDMAPFQILTFDPDTTQGRADAFAAVTALGFALSPEEVADWGHWIARSDPEDCD